MHPVLGPLHALFGLNTRLFEFCLEGMNDETARRRVTPETNHPAFLACHLIDARYFLGRMVGYPRTNPLADMLESVRSIDDLRDIPPLDALRDAWRTVSDELATHLASLSEEVLFSKAPQPFPAGDDRMIGAIAFLLQHEAFHLGQMALLRKAAGLPAMRYS